MWPMRTLYWVASVASVFALVGCTESHTPATDAGVEPDMLTIPPSLTACDVPSVCAVRSRSCCGSCGEPTPTDLVAVRADRLGDYAELACPPVAACPACAGRPDPYLLATCDTSGPGTGHCVAVDLHSSPLTECVVDGDCMLGPRTCCACGTVTDTEAIAFNLEHGSLRALVCDPDVTCPPCLPDFGMLLALCESGRCVARYPMR